MSSDVINLSDPLAASIRIPAGAVNRSLTSIPLVGSGVETYGEFIAEAQLRTLENFYNDEPPANPLIGQLWYDSTNDLLKVYSTDRTWIQVGVAPAISLNDLSDVRAISPQQSQFLIYDGTNWRNLTVSFRYDGLTDTPPARNAQHYIRVNNAGTAHNFVRRISTESVAGPLLLDQLPLQAICAELRARGCFPEPPPPDPVLTYTHVVGNACTTEIGRTCTVTGQLNASITNPQSLTPPFTYTWTRQSGVTLDQGNTVVVNSNQTVVNQPVSFSGVASSGGNNSNTTVYNLSVTDSASPANTVTAIGSQVNYVIIGEQPVDPIVNFGHFGGSVTVPTGTSGTATGSAFVTFDPTGTGTTGPYRYRWSVNDAGSALLIPEGGGVPQTSTITTQPSVTTSQTATAPDTLSRTLAVTVGTISGGSFSAIASENLPAATYNIIGEAVIPSHTLTVNINGVEQTSPPTDGFTVFYEDSATALPSGGVEVQQGRSTYLTIVRNSEDWRLETVSGCGPSTALNRLSDDTWVYEFDMPSGDCTVSVVTQEIAQQHTLSTVFPAGFTVSITVGSNPPVGGGFPGGALVTEGTAVSIDIVRTDSTLNLDSVTGCGGSLTQTDTDEWTYAFNMPSSDCTVTASASTVPLEATLVGSCNIGGDPGGSIGRVGVNCDIGGSGPLTYVNSVLFLPTTGLEITGGTGNYTTTLSIVSASISTSGPGSAQITGNSHQISGTSATLGFSYAPTGDITNPLEVVITGNYEITVSDGVTTLSPIAVSCRFVERYYCTDVAVP